MFKRKHLALLLVGLFGLVGCTVPSVSEGPDSSTGSTATSTDTSSPTSTTKERIRLQVWGPADEQALYEKHAAEFQALNPDITFIVDYGDVGEPDAAQNVLADVSTAADVFFFPDDQIAQMANKGVLAEIPTVYQNRIKARDAEGAVDAATYAGDDKMYGFPLSLDNGYFLVYNKKFFSEEDVETLEGILAKTSAEHQFVVDMGNGYYATSFIQYLSDITYNPITEMHSTNFNNQASHDALQGVINLLRPKKDQGFLSEDFNGAALSDLSDDNNNAVIAGVTGHWNTENIRTILGDDFGSAKLPTFKSANGSTVQWGSFNGSKLVGVKSSSNNKNYALAFADYISNEAAQQYRYETNGWGPTNTALIESGMLDDNPGLSALGAQAPYAISQGKSVGGTFWDPAAAVGNFIIDGPVDESSPQTLQAVLDAFVSVVTGAAAA